MKLTAGRVVLITGASAGIGRALALELAHRQASLALVARRGELLADVAAQAEALGARTLALPADVTDRGAVEHAVAATIEAFGRLDVLVNNAGRGHCAYVEDTPDEQLESMFRVNVFPLWYASAPAVRRMRLQGEGLVVTIASLAGKIGFPANAAYVAAKHAAVGFTRALRAELAGSGVEAIVVVPAGVATDWATVAEGGPMLDLFAYESERGREIARTEGIIPVTMPAVMSAEAVAAAIVRGIESPEPEVYTHAGERDLVRAYDDDQAAVEAGLAPYWTANREGYLRDLR